MFLFNYNNIVQELKFLLSAIRFRLIKTAIDMFRWNNVLHANFFEDAKKMYVEICITR